MFLCSPEMSVKRTWNGGEAAPVRCKRWSCPHCCELNRKIVIAKAIAGKPTAFLTLTLRSGPHITPDEAAAELKRGLVALRKRIARAWPGQKMSFLAVFEKHKSGYPHLHLMIRAPWMPISWLKASWEAITGSYQVNIQSIKSLGQRAFYVAKYVGKDLAAFESCKRWWRSHDYNEPRAMTEDEIAACKGWYRTLGNAYSTAKFLRHLGCEVVNLKDGRFTWVDPPTGPVDLKKAATAADHWYGYGYRRSGLKGAASC